MLPRLAQAGVNVKVIAAISEELFDRQPQAYRNAVLPPEARQDLMFVMSGTRRRPQRFAQEHPQRLSRQRSLLDALGSSRSRISASTEPGARSSLGFLDR